MYYPVLSGFGSSDVISFSEDDSADNLDGVMTGSVVTTHLLI